MSRIINTTSTVTVHPVEFDTSTSTYSSASNTGNGYADATSTTYAQFYLRTGSRAQTIVDYLFDLSEIPTIATINSVTCSAKVYISQTNANRIATRTAQLYSGNTAKGSTATVSTSTTAFSISAGSWTTTELQNAKIRLNLVRGTSSTNSSYYTRFYGSTLTVEYSLSTTAYTITGSSNVPGVSISPTTQEVYAGEDSEEIRITTSATDLNDIVVTDNGVDITEDLVRHEIASSGSITAEPSTYTATIPSGSFTNSSYFAYPIGYSAENPHTGGSAIYTSTRGLEGYADYTFDFSDIPAGVTITSVEVKCAGFAETTDTYTYKASDIQLFSGNTQKTSRQSFTSTSMQTITISNPGTWTRSELQNAKLRFIVGRYGGYLGGVSWTVHYETDSGAAYYWTYTLTNVNADHIILIEQDTGIIEPPEEDPDETYWPVTISSINADTDPGNGTTRVVEGSNMTVTIEPLDPQLTLALDNGVDITNQLVAAVPVNTYTVTEQVSGASYGFNLNNNTGYYVSTNNGVNKSASVARLNLEFDSDCLVTIQYINYAEANYDYGMFGKLDTEVATDGLTASSGSSSPSDSTNNYQLAMASNSSAAQTITYNVPAGSHFIDIKYGKDDGTSSNNDTLQWRVSNIEATSAGGNYTYTLTNITQKHSLIFVFGDVDYYFITSSSSSGAKLFPDGQQVKLAGDNYRITIIPDNVNAAISVTDNNVNITSSLQRVDGTDKNNQPYVNYIYTLSNISTNHNIVVSIGGAQIKLYIKENGTWVAYTKAYKKINGSWVEQADLSSVFNTSTNYRKGN